MTANNSLCDLVTNSLIERLQLGFEAHPIDGGCVIVTPFSHHDLASIELYVEANGDTYRLTDEGETLNVLFVGGMAIEDNKALLEQVQRIADTHSVDLERSTLSIRATGETLGEASQRLLNAIQAVSFLIYKRSHRKRLTFSDEVEELLLEHAVTYTPGYTVRGAANTHRVPFYVNSDRNLLLEPISAFTVPSARNKAKAIAYKWLDLREGKAPHSFIAIVDDKKQRWEKVWTDDEASNALMTYSDAVIRWTVDKPQFTEFLVEYKPLADITRRRVSPGRR